MMPANWPVSALLVMSCGLAVCPMGTSTGYSTVVSNFSLNPNTNITERYARINVISDIPSF